MVRRKRPKGRIRLAIAAKTKTPQFAAAGFSILKDKLFAAAQILFIFLTLNKLLFEVIKLIKEIFQ